MCKQERKKSKERNCSFYSLQKISNNCQIILPWPSSFHSTDRKVHTLRRWLKYQNIKHKLAFISQIMTNPIKMISKKAKEVKHLLPLHFISASLILLNWNLYFMWLDMASMYGRHVYVLILLIPFTNNW